MIALLISVFFLLIAFVSMKQYSFWQSRGISGPRPWPVVGNALSHMFQSSAGLDRRNFAKFGHVYGYYDGQRPVLMISDPEMLQQVFVGQFTDFQGSLTETLGKHPIEFNLIDGMIGDRWKRVRSVLTASFTGYKMRPITDSMRDSMDTLVKSMAKTAQSDKTEIMIKPLMTPHILDVTCRCFFSLNMNFYDTDKLLLNCAQLFFNVLAIPSSLLGAKIMKLPSYLGFTSNVQHGADYLGSFVRKAMKTRCQSDLCGSDVLQFLLDTEEEGDNLTLNELNEKEIVSNAAGFIASFDSTTKALCLLLWRLAIHQDVQDKVYQEMANVHDKDEVTYDDLQKLVYLEATIRETLRLNPLGARALRVSTAKTIVGHGVTIPSGTPIMVPVTVVHSDPENFKDPEQFRPERFLPENKHSIKSCTFLSFGAGPRTCVGMRFAILNIKRTVVEVLRRYQVVKCPKTLDSVNFDVVNVDDICIELTRR
ncbi:Cytochrome P450 3A24 [Halotydeus destructor]|nr:Cytochrome P450 3A24 [Halotydeus destructor]